MNIIQTGLPGLVVIEPRVFEDERGYFFESFQQERYSEFGIHKTFVQDNESKSVRGVIRGLHYQLAPYSQAKLVRAVQGKVFDVAMDLRKNSPTFGRWYGLELSDDNKRQLFIPQGFAHGFSVLSKTAVFTYKCDSLYNKGAERAINAFDPKLNIDWKLGKAECIISDKDKKAELFEDAEINFLFEK